MCGLKKAAYSYSLVSMPRPCSIPVQSETWQRSRLTRSLSWETVLKNFEKIPVEEMLKRSSSFWSDPQFLPENILILKYYKRDRQKCWAFFPVWSAWRYWIEIIEINMKTYIDRIKSKIIHFSEKKLSVSLYLRYKKAIKLLACFPTPENVRNVFYIPLFRINNNNNNNTQLVTRHMSMKKYQIWRNWITGADEEGYGMIYYTSMFWVVFWKNLTIRKSQSDEQEERSILKAQRDKKHG